MSPLNRYSIYYHDLCQRGIINFFLDRLKKYRFTRRLISIFFPSFVIISGRKLYIDKLDNVVSKTLISTGTWEPYTTSIFSKLAQRSKLVVDIGAHLGYYTLIASCNIKNGGRVIAFEPSRRSYSFLSQTITENNLINVVAVNKAIDAISGTGRLYLSPDNIGDHRIYPSSENRKYEDISTVSLDDYFKGDKRTIDLIKMDIQGNEVPAITGMFQLLRQKRIRHLLTELWPKGLLLNHTSWQEYIRMLKKYFQIWEIDDINLKIVPFNSTKVEFEFNRDPEYITNLLCFQKS